MNRNHEINRHIDTIPVSTNTRWILRKIVDSGAYAFSLRDDFAIFGLTNWHKLRKAVYPLLDTGTLTKQIRNGRVWVYLADKELLNIINRDK